MKITTVLGTRPEIIRLSRIIPLLDKYFEHILINTNQNFDNNLNEKFFSDLGLRNPDYILNLDFKSNFEQIGKILLETEKIILKEKPDKMLILGDTNSALSSIVAKRMGLKVYHLEAGNRCYDDRVPEEINRRIIDHSSDILMPYTYRSKENLVREGIDRKNIYVIGNPIFEVLNFYEDKITNSNILISLNLLTKKYILVTLHRSENVDIYERLNKFIDAFMEINKLHEIPIVLSLHPRTKSKIQSWKINIDNEKIMIIEPPGLFDFIKLEKNAKCVLTDSGTVQEECCIYKIPNVTIRDVTERPETIEAGSNILSGAEKDLILKSIDIAVNNVFNWDPPQEYLETNVSSKVLKIISSYSI